MITYCKGTGTIYVGPILFQYAEGKSISYEIAHQYQRGIGRRHSRLRRREGGLWSPLPHLGEGESVAEGYLTQAELGSHSNPVDVIAFLSISRITQAASLRSNGVVEEETYTWSILSSLRA